MSVRARLGAFDQRNREKGWYVFVQIYVLGGFLSAVGFYALALWVARDLIIHYGFWNAAFFLSIFINPFLPDSGFPIPMYILATGVVYWRYRRLYRTEVTTEDV